MVPVSKGDNGVIWLGYQYTIKHSRPELLTVVYIVETGMRVVRVVDNERTPQSVTVLGGQMAVVPERPYMLVSISLVDTLRSNIPAWSGTWKS